MIKTKSIYDDRDESDGTRILITRIYLGFIKKQHFDERMLVLSPDRDTLRKGNPVKRLRTIGKHLKKNSFPR
jgi:uncharacterized protein YeaO (DUF488 family)